MQIQTSFFPALNTDLENRIISFLKDPKDLFSLANVSSTLSLAHVQKTQVYFEEWLKNLKQENLPTWKKIKYQMKKNVKKNPIPLLLAHQATQILFTIGKLPFQTLEIFADFQNFFLENHQPWIQLALKKLDVESFTDVKKICKEKIGFKCLELNEILLFVQQMCKKNKFKEAINFFKDMLNPYTQIGEIDICTEIIKTAIVEQQDWDSYAYMISKIAEDGEKISECLYILEKCAEELNLEKGLTILKHYQLDLTNINRMNKNSLLLIYLNVGDFTRAWDLIGDLSDLSQLTENQISLIETLKEVSVELGREEQISKATYVLQHLT